MLGREDNKINYNYIREYLIDTLPEDNGVLKQIRDKANETETPLLMEETAKFLEIMVKIINPCRILEAGTATGYSSILMCKAAGKKVTIDTVEQDYDSIIVANSNIKEAGFAKNIHIIAGDFTDVFSNLSGIYDMIFMDAAKGSYLDVLPHCTRLLKDGGVLISDNVLYKGMVAEDRLVKRRQKTIVRKMREYLDFLCNQVTYNTSIIPIGDGVAVSIKTSKE